MLIARRSFLSFAMGLVVVCTLAACGGGPLDVDAAADLLPQALAKGTALESKLKAIDSPEAAAAARPELEPLAASFSAMMAKLVAVKPMFRRELKGAWTKVDAAAGAIRARAASWAADVDGPGGKIASALGSDLMDRIMDLPR